MKDNYQKGNYGYGHAKNDLFQLIIEKYFRGNPGNIDNFNYAINRKQALNSLDEFLGQHQIDRNGFSFTRIACSLNGSL